MSEPVKAAVFICRAHGADLTAFKGVMKDARVGHMEILPSCCSQEGRDQIQLHLLGRTTGALLVLGCRNELLDRYQAMAASAGIPPARVAVVPSSIRTGSAAELALARVLDPRQACYPPERRSDELLLIGEGATADAALDQVRKEGLTVLRARPEELHEAGGRLLGGPGNFVLEVREVIREFGAALVVFDQEVRVERDRLSDRPGTAVLLAGGEECATAFTEELEGALGRREEVYAVAQEAPYCGIREIDHRGLQLRGVVFLRAPDVKVQRDGVMVLDEYLGGEILLPVGTLVTVSSSRPALADGIMRLFGLPAGRRSRDLVPGESGMPGVYLGGSALTCLFDGEAAQAVRAAVVTLTRELGLPAERTPLARVDDEMCSLCLTCLRLCPYHAPFLDGGKMAISLERCRGCGMCLAMCPSQAIEMPPTDLRGEVGGTRMEGGAPR